MSFLCQYWISQKVCQFESLAQFLYNTIQEDDFDYPACLTWIDNVTIGDDSDLYASRLLFVLTCSKCVHDTTLCSLDEFVNDTIFSIDYILQLGKKLD